MPTLPSCTPNEMAVIVEILKMTICQVHPEFCPPGNVRHLVVEVPFESADKIKAHLEEVSTAGSVDRRIEVEACDAKTVFLNIDTRYTP